MNFLKSFITGNGIGNLPFEIEKAADRRICNEYEIVNGKHKSTPNVLVSIFKSNSDQPEPLKLITYQLASHALKFGKILRHPNILTIMDGIELPFGQIVYVTERVMPLMEYVEQMRTKYGKNSKQEMQNTIWGMHSILSALKFLNQDNDFIHGRVCPYSIFVTQGGEWKLGGLELVTARQDLGANSQLGKHPNRLDKEYKTQERAQCNYSEIRDAATWSTDIWSLACLMHYMYTGNPGLEPNNIPAAFRSGYKKMVHVQAKSRISPEKLLTHAYFKTPLVATMYFLESLVTSTEDEKTAFFSTLLPKLDDFPMECCKYKILPILQGILDVGCNVGGAFGPSAGFIIPIIIHIGCEMEEQEFGILITPTLRKLFACKDRNVRLQLLQFMDKIAKYLDAKLINTELFVHLCTGFADSASIIRELTVKSMLHIVDKLSDDNLNSKLVKHFAKLQGDAAPVIRTNTTICIGKVAKNLNEKTRTKVLLPAFFRSLKDPFTHARIAGLRSMLACNEYFSAPQIAKQILPSIAPLLVDSEAIVRDETFKAMSKYMDDLQIISAEMKMKEEQNKAELPLVDPGEIAPCPPPPSQPAEQPKAHTIEATSFGLEDDDWGNDDALGNDGWGDDSDLDLGASPMNEQQKSSSKNAMQSKSSFFDDDFNNTAAKPVKNQQRKNATLNAKQKPSTSMKLTKPASKKKTEEWDDWDF